MTKNELVIALNDFEDDAVVIISDSKGVKQNLMLAWCWTLYYMGHVTSRALVPIWSGFYPLYNNLMHLSVNVNDKYGFDVWKEKTNERKKEAGDE